MSNMTPIIPTLHAVVGVISNPQEVIAYLVRHFVTNPGGTSSTVEEETLSIQKLASYYGNDKNTMAGAAQEQLSTAISRFYPGQGINVDVVPTDIDGYRYGLTIDIGVTFNDERKPILVSGIIKITNENEFIINFQN